MRSICGCAAQSEGSPDADRAVATVAAMLAVLPGRGRGARFESGRAAFGYRELRKNEAEGAEHGEGSGYRAIRGLCILADARLDHRGELGEALGLPGSEVAGIKDCELIARAYGRWGGDCPLHLYGDYAFAIWNPGRGSLFCARDAIGARPFYYTSAPGGRFAFASDLNALLAAPGVDDALDEAFVTAYLKGDIAAAGRTFFSAVRSLPPGHSLAVRAGAPRLRRWWRPEDAPDIRLGSDEAYRRAFLEHYRRAVRDRLDDAGEVGAHLSGGLDSSSIAVLAARELRPSGRRLHALCWHPPPNDSQPEEEAAEYRLIESVCAQENLAPHYHSPSADHLLARLRLDVTRAPDLDGTLTHESLVQRSAADLGVRVILSGWGGDEIASCAGGGYYPGLLLRGQWRTLLRESRGRAARPWRFLARQALLPLAHPRAATILGELSRGRWPRRRQRRRSFVHPALARKHRIRGSNPGRVLDVRRRQLAMLAQGHLEQRIECWAAAGMRTGIEYRYPLLDRRLVEFVLGLPAGQFRPGRSSRWLFRQAMKGVLPECVRENRSKSDPARYEPMRQATREALPRIARQLNLRREPLARAPYLHMAGLRGYLQAAAGRSGQGAQTGKIKRALKFLDWQEG